MLESPTPTRDPLRDLLRRWPLAVLVTLLAAGCEPESDTHWPPGPARAETPTVETIEVPPPPFSEGVFPCTECHEPELPYSKRRRVLKTAHEDIVFKHDSEHRWCLDCHSGDNRDKLHLASGELIDFTESHRLCGQCHGDKYRDWRVGVHGRRSGDWNGKKTYLLCVHCHTSHDPAFKPIEPKPAPRRPTGEKP